MQCCKNNLYPPHCHEVIIPCKDFTLTDGSFKLNAEIGDLNKHAKHGLYAGIGLSKQSRYHLGEFLIAKEDNKNFVSVLRFQSHFLSFPFQSLKPINNWHRPVRSKKIRAYGRLYLGTELWAYAAEGEQGYIDQNIHLGFAYVSIKQHSVFPRLFFQYGLGVNHLNDRQFKSYPFFQLGLKITFMSNQ